MKRLSFIYILCVLVLCVRAQKKEWSSPFVGYSTTKVLTLDKVKFEKGKTLLHATVTASGGNTFRVSPNAYLSANGKHYVIQDATVLGLDKRYTMPDSGKVHFTMQFGQLPANTRLMHFTEGMVETGWTLCNIMENKDNLITKMPMEWRDVTYPDREFLPESYFSDDSTYVRVTILNYVPEAGTKMETYYTPFLGDNSLYSKEYDIASDGTCTIGLHLCVPRTINLRLGKASYFHLLVMPGKDISILMDLGKGGTEPVVAFKGELARANYEINLKGAKDLYQFDNSDAHFESVILSGKSLGDEYHPLIQEYVNTTSNNHYATSTQDWLFLYAESRTINHLLQFDRYVNRRLKEDLQAANSPLLKNNSIMNNIRTINDVRNSHLIAHSHKMTFCPDFLSYYTEPKDGGEAFRFNKDIMLLHWALNGNATGSYKAGETQASLIQDSTIKAYYPIAAKRWNDYVTQLNSIPHIHFDQHGEVRTEELKNKVLEDYRGKNVVFLVYDRDLHDNILDELEKKFISKANNKKMVFIHIDTRSASLLGVETWVKAARQRMGEHYSGKKNRYDSMFSGHSPFFDKQFYYELYAPDGTCTLQTTDKDEAFTAIGKLVRQ